MVIKESNDVVIMLIEKHDAIQKLGPNMRMWIVNQIMELYHEVREAEGCRTEYGMWCTTDERKEQLKTEFKEHTREAQHLADFIDGELKRVEHLKEAVAEKQERYFDEMNSIINGENKG